MVIDYRALNAATIPSVLRVPRLDDVLDSVGETNPQYFSVLDCTQGFHQIPLDPESRSKTGFITPMGKFRYKTMPQGIKNAPATFQALMDTLLRGVQYKYVAAYIDDIILFSHTFNQHLTHIREVLTRLRAAKLKLHPKKCSFAVKQVAFLGHVLKPHGISPDPGKIEAIRSYPEPKKLKQVRGFLGLSGFYRRFIPEYAHLARPLYHLTRKDVPFKWTDDCQQAFDALKEAITSDTVLAFPDFRKPFILATDASKTGVGACLSQKHDGELRPIAFAGRGFTKAESNYTTTEQELLGVVFAIQHFRVYLTGNEFELHTDHSALRWILGLNEPQGRLARWVTFLQQFQYKVLHVKGKDNVVPDALSRRPYNTTYTPADDVINKFPDLDDVSLFIASKNDLLDAINHPEPPIPAQTKNISPPLSNNSVSFQEGATYNATRPKTPDLHKSILKNKGQRSGDLKKKCEVKEPPAFPQDHDGLAKVSPSYITCSSLSSPCFSKSNKRREKLRSQLQARAKINWDDVNFSRGHIKQQQYIDPQCRRIISFLKFGALPKRMDEARAILLRQEDYIIIDDLLYHIFTSHGPKPHTASAQLVIPQSLKKQFLQIHHDSMLGGHIGAARMLSVMRPRYFWIGMIKDVNDYVGTCQSCNASKPSNRSIKPPLTLRDPAPGPFHTLFIDTLGPLRRTQHANKHLVVVTDQYSRYVIAWPSPDIQAKTIAKKFYEKVICVHGAPKRLLSDNGSGFISELFQELCATFGVKQSFSTAYRPQAQGEVERCNRSITNLLRNFVNTKQTDWDKYITPLVWALNTSENRPLGYSSFLLVFGRLPVFPAEADLPDPLTMNNTVRDHLADIVQRQAECSRFAEQHLREQQAQMKKQHDKKATDTPIHPGDTVYVYQPRIRVSKTKKKLQKNFHGPFLVVKLNTPTTVMLRRLSDGKYLTKAVNVARLKKGHVRAKLNNWDPLPPPTDNDDQLSEDDIPLTSFEHTSPTRVSDSDSDNDSPPPPKGAPACDQDRMQGPPVQASPRRPHPPQLYLHPITYRP